MVGGAAQTLGPAQSLDQSDVKERQQHARDEKAHRRLDPVKDVAGLGDVTERTKVDEEVLVGLALWRRQRGVSGSAQSDVGWRTVGQVALSHCEVNPDVVAAGKGHHQLTVVDELCRRVLGGRHQRSTGNRRLIEQTSGRQRRGSEQIERRQIPKNADDVGQHHDHTASVATRHPSTAGTEAAPTVGVGGV